MNYKNIKLDKSLYKAEGGFSKQLELLDPSENYSGSEMGQLDAFQRQLKRFDIKIKGSNSDTISKFFATSDSVALFPEYISRAVAKGTSDASNLQELIASTTEINSLDYRSITTILGKFSDNPILEGSFLPNVEIKLSDYLINAY